MFLEFIRVGRASARHGELGVRADFISALGGAGPGREPIRGQHMVSCAPKRDPGVAAGSGAAQLPIRVDFLEEVTWAET